ncbi:arginine-binding periplasmic protein [Legionella wadsworthii]|uniref:Arginine-binding periplasmic protein n=1 Tax=Legionella wadsworthii TaxID=28088 RepID=A0A378LR43_9GAMM|nr:transporter substrate-binding domain-containing protein [Legionella wadsworthii]STY29187.1 arginine-binding periplasmic protein [Legionella wadsworthii]
MRIKTIIFALGLLISSIAHTTINIGTLIFKPPYIFSPGNGFDIALGQLICQQLNEQCNFLPMGMDRLYTQLKAGNVDLAMGGIPISYALNYEFIFSLPYMLSKGQFLILQNSPINSVTQLQGKKIGVLRNLLNGGLFFEYLSDHYPKFQIKRYDDVEDLLADLHSNAIAAVFLNRSSVNYWTQEGGDQFKPLGTVHTIGDGVAILALPKNKELIDRVNSALKTIQKDSSYIKLYNTYFVNE